MSNFDDPLGTMLTEYDEYLDGKRPYESLRIYEVLRETETCVITSMRLSEEERAGLRANGLPEPAAPLPKMWVVKR